MTEGEIGLDFLTITQGPLCSIPSFSLPRLCRPLPQVRRPGVPITQPTQLTSPDSIWGVVRCAPRLFSSRSAPLPPLLGPTSQPVVVHRRLPCSSVLCDQFYDSPVRRRAHQERRMAQSEWGVSHGAREAAGLPGTWLLFFKMSVTSIQFKDKHDMARVSVNTPHNQQSLTQLLPASR